MTDETRTISSQERNDLFKYTSVQRISQIPVVESGYKYVNNIYTRVKNSNRLVRWSLSNVEGGIQIAVDKTMPTVLLLDLPLTMVDTIICKGLDTVSVAIPAINYPPEELVSMGKCYVSSNLITPVLQRADSVKQLGLSEANRVGEMAASTIDNALDIADKYVDKFLPDSTDTTDGKKEEETKDESKTTQAIHHMNRLGKKLQRRLTKRTLMEAEALRKGSQDIAQTIIYLADLLLRDPKGFADKMKEAWNKLSEDEPENQVPPANIEQLVALLARESARRVVHVANFIVSTLPAHTAHAFRYTVHHTQLYANYFLKVVHLEGAKGIAYATSSERLSQLRTFVLHLLEVLGSKIKESKGRIDYTPLRVTATTESKSIKSTSTQGQNTSQPESNNTQEDKKAKKNKNKSNQANQEVSPPKISVTENGRPTTPVSDSPPETSSNTPLSSSSTPISSPPTNTV